MDDPVSFAAESATRVQTLVTKAKGALSTMFGLVFPKLPQDKKLEAENTQLRKDLAERVQAANKMTEEAWQANEDLKTELAKVKEELAKAKKAEEQKKKEEASANKALQHLVKAIEALLGNFRIC